MNLNDLEEIYAELGSAVMQMAPSDDQIICDHVRKAYALADALMRRVQDQADCGEVPHA